MNNKEGDLRIWWIPQVSMESQFYVPVASMDEAVKIYKLLADYDIFQFKNQIKGDYTNVGGLQIFESGKWEDWENEEYGDIDEYIDGCI